MTGERIVARDVRDECPVGAFPAVQDERDVGGERAVGAEHEQTEAAGFDRVVQDGQLALSEVGVLHTSIVVGFAGQCPPYLRRRAARRSPSAAAR
jgi:hypothetical protein